MGAKANRFWAVVTHNPPATIPVAATFLINVTGSATPPDLRLSGDLPIIVDSAESIERILPPKWWTAGMIATDPVRS